MRRRAAALACALTCAASPAAAHAAERSPATVRAVAAAATPGDPAARAREQARDVLAQRRFQPAPIPAPLRSVRERIGEALRSLGRPFADAFRRVADWLPGGSTVLIVVLCAGVLLIAAAIATRGAARRAAGATGRAAARAGYEQASAADMRRQADDAERAGDLDGALRLRFRAGLVDLDSQELIELRPALTNHELLRAVPSPTLAELVDGFEAVAYGGRPAAAGDLRTARDGWPRVAAEAGAR